MKVRRSAAAIVDLIRTRTGHSLLPVEILSDETFGWIARVPNHISAEKQHAVRREVQKLREFYDLAASHLRTSTGKIVQFDVDAILQLTGRVSSTQVAGTLSSVISTAMSAPDLTCAKIETSDGVSLGPEEIKEVADSAEYKAITVGEHSCR